MHKIKFSHDYMKMPHSDDYRETSLMEVLTASTEDLAEGFIEYDTTYYERNGSVLIKQNYPLPKGKVLILILNSPYAFKYVLWTTVRRWTPEKEKYYRSIRGQNVEIVIEEDKGLNTKEKKLLDNAIKENKELFETLSKM